MLFTDKRIRALKPRASAYVEIENTESRGDGRLGIRVQPSGAKRWVFQWFENGKRRTRTLGAFPAVKTSDARLAAIELTAEYQAEGTVKRPEKVRHGSFGDLLANYIDTMRAEGRRSADEVERALQLYVRKPFSHLMDQDAAEITPEDIASILRPIYQRGALTSLNRVRSYLVKAFSIGVGADADYASPSGGKMRFGLNGNPAAATPYRGEYERTRDLHWSVEDMQTVWSALMDVVDGRWDGRVEGVPRKVRCNAQTATLLALAMLTGIRSGEWRRMPWSAIDGDVLTIPAEVFKLGKAHKTVLPQRAVDLLGKLKKDSPWVFPSRNRGKALEGPSDMKTVSLAMQAVVLKAQVAPQQPRDLRKILATYGHQAGIDLLHINLLQGHTLSGAQLVSATAEKHYIKSDFMPEKRAGIEKWERWFRREIAGEPQTAQIVAIGGRSHG